MIKRLILLAYHLAICTCILCAGEPVRPVLSSYTGHIGSAHIAETYLSPLRYSGQSFGLDYERMQAMKFDPERWVSDMRISLLGARTLNQAQSTTIWQAAVEGGWGMMRRFDLNNGFRAYFGGTTDISAGLFYSERNTNNPVAAKVSWTVGAMGAIAWNGTIKKLPVCLRYQASMPLTGIFFSPEYGELYYEIYLGNHKGLVRGAWPGNFFRLNNLLSADLRFGATVLRLGYRLNYASSKASGIVSRNINHCAVIGFCSEWVSLSATRKVDSNAKITSALY